MGPKRLNFCDNKNCTYCNWPLVQHASFIHQNRLQTSSSLCLPGQCKHGVCSVTVTKTDMSYTFQNLGIQCVRKKDAPASLDARQKIRVDPFKQGFDHKNGAIDLNMVRLCFQVVIEGTASSSQVQMILFACVC